MALGTQQNDPLVTVAIKAGPPGLVSAESRLISIGGCEAVCPQRDHM